MSFPRSSLLLACTVLLVPALAHGQELRYKFQAGTATAYTMDQNQSMKMSAMGQELDMKMNTTFEFSMKVDSVDTATGDAKVKYKFDRVIMKTDGMPMGDMEYDTKSGKEPEGLLGGMIGPMFKALTESEISMTVSPRGEVSDVKMPDKLKEQLQSLAAGGGGMGGGFSEDQLKQIMNNPVFTLPKEAVSNGTTWDNKMEMKMGPMGTMKIVNKYTYAGKSGNFEKIDQKIDMKIEAGTDAPFQMNIKTKEASGTILFDNAKGRIQETTTKTVMDMELGPVGTMNMTQTTTMKLK